MDCQFKIKPSFSYGKMTNWDESSTMCELFSCHCFAHKTTELKRNKFQYNLPHTCQPVDSMYFRLDAIWAITIEIYGKLQFSFRSRRFMWKNMAEIRLLLLVVLLVAPLNATWNFQIAINCDFAVSLALI